MTGARRSIRGTLTRTLLLGAGLFIVALAWSLDVVLTGFLQDRFDADILRRAQALITLTIVEDDGEIELEFAGEFMPEMEEPEGPEFFEIYLPDGELLERSESLGDNAIHVHAQFTPEPIFRDITMDNVGWCRLLRISFYAQDDGEDIEGSLEVEDPNKGLTLLLAHRSDAHRGFIAKIRVMVWGSFGLLLVLVVVLVRLALVRGLAPLDEIRGQVGALDPEALTGRVALRRDVTELEPVVDQLNGLLDRLETVIVRERRFTSDVAHELRTPLAELRTLAEVGARDPEDTETVLVFFGDVREIALEMQQLVTTLLALARGDSGSLVEEPVPLDLTEICDKVCQRLAREAEARRIEIERRFTGPVAVLSDRAMTEQIIGNLLENAVTYSPVGATVVIAGSGRRLEITNPAPDLTDADLTLCFDRFWQKDSARTGGKHAGLGLALVQTYADCLEIELDVRLIRGQLTFVLTFPCGSARLPSPSKGDAPCDMRSVSLSP